MTPIKPNMLKKSKAQAQRISNREFKLWTFLQGTESRVVTFLAETSTAVEFGSRTPKSDHGNSENVKINYLSSPNYSYFSIAVSFFKVILYKL